MNDDPKSNFVGNGTIQKLTRLLAAPIVEPSQRAARIQTVEKDIVLPLRVLTIAILGYYFFFSGWFDTPASTASSTYSAEQIKDYPRFIQRLSEQSNSISAFLWHYFPGQDQERLLNYQASAPDAKQTRKLVVQSLNKIITGPSIYDPERFKGVPLRPETIDLLKRTPKDTNVASLNRFLLEDAYPQELSGGAAGGPSSPIGRCCTLRF